MPKEQVTMFDTDVTQAADDFIEAYKQFKDAKDVVECSRKFLAGLLKKNGLSDKQYIKHDGKIITLKEGIVQEDTVLIKDDKKD
jgi:hypothetical protein